MLPLGGTRMALVHAMLAATDRSISFIRRLQGHDHMLRKGQIEGIAKRDVLAQNGVINHMFGLAA
jgi:hypothetical protein